MRTHTLSRDAHAETCDPHNVAQGVSTSLTSPKALIKALWMDASGFWEKRWSLEIMIFDKAGINPHTQVGMFISKCLTA